MSEKSVFPETLSPEMTPKSFTVSRFCTPPEVKFHVFSKSKHEEGKIAIETFFCYSYKYIVEILSSK